MRGRLILCTAVVGFLLAGPPPASTAQPSPDEAAALERADFPAGARPQDERVRTRRAVGLLALVPAGLLLTLFFYRRRPYLLPWVGAWVAIALQAWAITTGVDVLRAPPDAAGDSLLRGRALVGAAQVLTLTNAWLIWLGVKWFRTPGRLGRGPWLLAATALAWTPLVLAGGPGIRWALGAGYLVAGAIILRASVAGWRIARADGLVGAHILGAALAAVGLTNVAVTAAVVTGDAGLVVPNWLILTQMIWKGFESLGMHVLVFEDMTRELAATHARLADAHKDLETLASTDPLTGCYNRRFFDEVASRELLQHRRHGLPLSLLFVDCDRFKAINDTLGHETGDEVLRTLGGILRARVRGGDTVFRWGGDEFVILLSADEAQAEAKAAEIQHAFAAAPLSARLPPGSGVSIGWVAVPPDADSLLPWVQTADARMFERKRLA